MEQFYQLCAILGGTIFVGQFVLALVGLAGDHDFSGDSGADHFDGGGDHADGGGHDGGECHQGGSEAGHDSATWWFISVLSVRTAVAGLTFFGLAGLAANASGSKPAGSLAVAVLAGMTAVYVVGWMMRSLSRLRADGTVRIQNAVGQMAVVYLTIPGHGAGKGKITVTVQNRTMEYEAQTQHEPLATGSTVQVVAIVGSDTVEVIAVPEPARTSHV